MSPAMSIFDEGFLVSLPPILLLAATVITCIPLIVILLIMQKYIMQGIKITGIK